MINFMSSPYRFIMSFDSNGVYMVMVAFYKYVEPCVCIFKLQMEYVIEGNLSLPKNSCFFAFPMSWLVRDNHDMGLICLD